MKHRKLLAACIVLAVLLIVAVRLGSVRASDEEILESVASIRDAVRRRALQCYVIEGAYPENLEYLEENYGLTVNHDEYLIVYNAYAENLPPEVIVRYRGKG